VLAAGGERAFGWRVIGCGQIRKRRQSTIQGRRFGREGKQEPLNLIAYNTLAQRDPFHG